jgi:hypothetical protein
MMNVIANLRSSMTSIASFAARYRRLCLVGAVLLFVAGIMWSVSSLDLQLSELQVWPALLLLLVFGPISVAYGAVGLLLLGAIADVRVSLRTACRVGAYAQLAEVLPIPGGAILRAGALIRAGAGAIDSSALVVASSLLWISMAAAATGFVITDISHFTALLLFGVGLGVSAAVCYWFANKSNWSIVRLILVHRCTGLLVNAARLKCAFAIVSVTLPLKHCLPFALATITGSATSIAPAGLGISETLGAVIAGSLSVAAPSAFLALALNRILALLGSALVAIGCEVVKPTEKEHHGEQPRTA